MAAVVAATLVALLGLDRAWMPAWLADLPRAVPPVAAAAITALAAVAIQQWATRRNAEADAEHAAVAQLKKHLGRQLVMPRIGQRGAGGLALRVHRAIPLDADAVAGSVDGGSELPLFVERDRGAEIRAWMREARDTGGFLLLVGDSSVGKTRLLYESAATELGDFVVLNPDLGDGNLVNEVAKATFPLPKMVVWLDELQTFLDGPYLNRDAGHSALTTAAVRQLLSAPTPIVIVATLWPEYAAALRATTVAPATGQTVPRHPEAVNILDTRQLHQLRIEPFAKGERERAAILAARDPRLVAALADRDFNVTEALAGAAEMMRRYEQGNQEQRAVIQAAVDARRLGIQATLTTDLLRAAARGYLTTTHIDDTWFDLALAEVSRSTTAQDRATAPLPEVHASDRAGILGVTVADYLLQRLAPVRRAELLTGYTWQALLDHTHNQEDLERLGDSMNNRLLYQYAGDAYRRLTDPHGSGAALWKLKVRLGVLGATEDIQAFTEDSDDDDEQAADRTVEVLEVRWWGDELWAFTEDSDEHVAWKLVEVLGEQGDAEELRALAEDGNEHAASKLFAVLAAQGELEELRAYAEYGDEDAAGWLANVLAEQGEVEELRALAEYGNGHAARRLAGVLAERGEVEELRAYAEYGDEHAARRLVEVLAERGEVEELQARAEYGDEHAADWLADVLAEQGELDAAVAVATAAVHRGNTNAGRRLTDFIARNGDPATAERIRRFGLNPDGSVNDGSPPASTAPTHRSGL